jgi:N-acetyl-anhydromuramyl-L-alanine amidase AmpD
MSQSAADYPGAVWMPAHPSNFRHGREGYVGPTHVLIHCTDGHPEAEGIGHMWQELGHGSSAHACVGQNGTVIQAVRFSDTAWHAHKANAYSVGIEHCARTPGEWERPPYNMRHDPGLLPSAALYVASAKLVAWLCSEVLNAFPTRMIIRGHSEADPDTTHTKCPLGCGWDWTSYMSLVLREYAIIRPAV